MDRLIYTAMSGMTSAMARQRMIASNMANTQTIGFRAETMQFTPMTLDGESIEVRAMNVGEVHGASMRSGTVMQTGRELDIAMTGDTLLAVQARDGAEAYTRRGDLTISGRLVPGEGGRAREVERLLTSGADRDTLARAGVGWVVTETRGELTVTRIGGDHPPARHRALMLVTHVVWLALMAVGGIGALIALGRRRLG